MPLVYRCNNCGFVLHYLEHVGQDFIGVPSITEVLSRYGYTCPKCKSRLSRPSQENILITSVGVAKKKNLLPMRIGDDYYVMTKVSLIPGYVQKSISEVSH
jgi:rubredoxin